MIGSAIFQLELSGLAGHRIGNVGADDLETDLINHFGNHGVHFGGHDRGAGLHRRQAEFVKFAARTRREPAHVVADFGELQLLV